LVSGTGGSGGTGGESPGECEARGELLVQTETEALSNLYVSGERLIFLSTKRDVYGPNRIVSVALDGTDATDLASSEVISGITGLYVHAGAIYFLEETPDSTDINELFSIPVAGGPIAQVGTERFNGGLIFGVDDDFVYMQRGTKSPVGVEFLRVSLTDGSAARMASYAASAGAIHTQIADGRSRRQLSY
jgi:hypothetical protein